MNKPFDATHKSGELYFKKGISGYAMYWNGTHWRESASVQNKQLETFERV